MKHTDFSVGYTDERGNIRLTKHFPQRIKCEGCPAKSRNVLLVRVNGFRRHLRGECRRVLEQLDDQESHVGAAL